MREANLPFKLRVNQLDSEDEDEDEGDGIEWFDALETPETQPENKSKEMRMGFYIIQYIKLLRLFFLNINTKMLIFKS